MVQNIASVVTAVAVIFVVFQLVGDRNSRHREFENLYVQRYWSLTDQLSFDPWSKPTRRSLSERDHGLCRAYLRLCEDEVELRIHGYVTDQTWTLWADGIRVQTNVEPFKEILGSEPEDQLLELRKFLKDGEDPLKRKGLARWWSGLR